MEIIAALAIALIAAVLGSIFWPVFGTKFQRPVCRLLSDRDSDARIEQVLNFYVDRISFQERISPQFLHHYLNSTTYSIHDIRLLAARCSSSKSPIHVLLYVILHDQILGVTKLIYVCPLRAFFIAYYAAKPHSLCTSADILTLMLKFVSPTILDKNHFIYEICHHNDAKRAHIAKERLFRHYAEQRHFAVKRVLANYLQPEVSAFNESCPEPTPGELYVISRNQKTLSSLNAIEILDHIFNEIYFDSFRTIEPDKSIQYRHYLDTIRLRIIEGM